MMGKLLSFPNNKNKGNAEIHIEAEMKYVDDPKRLIYEIRLRRIMESLDRINQLMRQFKETKNEN